MQRSKSTSRLTSRDERKTGPKACHSSWRMSRIAALVTPPLTHRYTCIGVLAPHSMHRAAALARYKIAANATGTGAQRASQRGIGRVRWRWRGRTWGEQRTFIPGRTGRVGAAQALSSLSLSGTECPHPCGVAAVMPDERWTDAPDCLCQRGQANPQEMKPYWVDPEFPHIFLPCGPALWDNSTAAQMKEKPFLFVLLTRHLFASKNNI